MSLSLWVHSDLEARGNFVLERLNKSQETDKKNYNG